VVVGDCSLIDTQPQSARASLGYSRHYAQRIRDLGQTSKDSWIRRLWNHMFGHSSNTSKKVSIKVDEATTHGGVAGGVGNLTARRISDHVYDRQIPADNSPYVDVTEPNGIKRYLQASHPDRHDVAIPVGQRQTRSSYEPSGRAMPPQLVNSPYLPAKEKVIYYRPALSSKPNTRNGITAAKLRYQRLSKSSTTLRPAPDTNDEHHKPPSTLYQVRRQFRRDAAIIQMENRAKVVADRAILVCVNYLNCMVPVFSWQISRGTFYFHCCLYAHNMSQVKCLQDNLPTNQLAVGQVAD